MHTTMTNMVNTNAIHTSGLQVTKYDSDVAWLLVYFAYSSYLRHVSLNIDGISPSERFCDLTGTRRSTVLALT